MFEINLCPSSWWCHPIISSSVVPFSSCLQSISIDYPILDIFQGSHIPVFSSFHGWILFYHRDRPHFAHVFISWWTFGLFFFLSTVNNAARNMCVQTFMWTCFHSSWVLNPGVEALACVVTLFTILRNHQTVFQSDCTICLPTSSMNNGSHFPTSSLTRLSE